MNEQIVNWFLCFLVMVKVKINESCNYKKCEDKGKCDKIKIENVFTILF